LLKRRLININCQIHQQQILEVLREIARFEVK
jgi:hypothetical protein